MNEQQIEYFKSDEIMYIHYSNQLLNTAIEAGTNKLLFLEPPNTFGSKHTFVKDSAQRVYRVEVEQFSQENVNKFYYYIETEEIRDAFQRLSEGKYEGLKESFETLVKQHPTHWFLEGVLQHVTYIEDKTSEQLQKQFSKIAGSYKNRVFWVENGKLYYKRDNLAKLELLPISETRYINLSKYITNHEFEFLKDNQIASYAWTYNVEKNEWSKLADERNYLLKN